MCWSNWTKLPVAFTPIVLFNRKRGFLEIFYFISKELIITMEGEDECLVG